jgi:hypothetical protein
VRREMLPLERAPQIAEAAPQVFQAANLPVCGESTQHLAQPSPLLGILARAVDRSASGCDVPA